MKASLVLAVGLVERYMSTQFFHLLFCNMQCYKALCLFHSSMNGAQVRREDEKIIRRCWKSL